MQAVFSFLGASPVALILAVLLSVALALLCWRGWRGSQATALAIVDWIRSGMAGLGHVGSAYPDSRGLLHVPLEYEDARMRNASATVVFGERGEAVEVVLCCDLDHPPRHEALIGSSRWGLCSRPVGVQETLAGWQLRKLGLFALTSQRGLVHDYNDLMHSLLESSAVGTAYLELDSAKPHLTLTLALESGGLPSPARVFNLLRRLADAVPQHSH